MVCGCKKNIIISLKLAMPIKCELFNTYNVKKFPSAYIPSE